VEEETQEEVVEEETQEEVVEERVEEVVQEVVQEEEAQEKETRVEERVQVSEDDLQNAYNTIGNIDDDNEEELTDICSTHTERGPKTDTYLNYKNMKDLLINVKKLQPDITENYKQEFKDLYIELRKKFCKDNRYGLINLSEEHLINKLDFAGIIDIIYWLYDSEYNEKNQKIPLGAQLKRLYDECLEKCLDN